MFAKRSKTILLIALTICGILGYVLGHFEIIKTDGSKGSLISEYAYQYDILLTIGINIILAVGLNLINGYTGQFSLGHAGFMAVGAYFSAWLTVNYGLVFGAGIGATLFFVIALLAGGAGAATTGFLVGVPSLRLRGDYLAIVTLGFNEIIRGVIQNTEPLGAQRGLGGMAQHTNFFWTFTFVILTVYVVLSLVHSTYGRGFLAVRDDEVAAEAMGIHTTKYKVIAFVVGAFFAGIAGGLYAHFKQFIHPQGFDFYKTIDIVVMVIVGGMGSTLGVIFAAVLLTILPEVLRYVSKIETLPEWLRHISENRMILYSLLLIILMIVRPQGLFGNKLRAKK